MGQVDNILRGKDVFVIRGHGTAKAIWWDGVFAVEKGWGGFG